MPLFTGFDTSQVVGNGISAINSKKGISPVILFWGCKLEIINPTLGRVDRFLGILCVDLFPKSSVLHCFFSRYSSIPLVLATSYC